VQGEMIVVLATLHIIPPYIISHTTWTWPFQLIWRFTFPIWLYNCWNIVEECSKTVEITIISLIKVCISNNILITLTFPKWPLCERPFCEIYYQMLKLSNFLRNICNFIFLTKDLDDWNVYLKKKKNWNIKPFLICPECTLTFPSDLFDLKKMYQAKEIQIWMGRKRRRTSVAYPSSIEKRTRKVFIFIIWRKKKEKDFPSVYRNW
jgi:hypothetical protein